MISVRRKENKTIIIQNLKKEYLSIFTYLIGIYSVLNLISILGIDINLSYKFYLIGLIPTILLLSLRAYLKNKIIVKVYMIVDNREFLIKRKKGKKDIILLDNIEKIVIKKIEGIFNLVLKLKNNTEDTTIWETSYSSDLRLIRKIILEYKVKGEE